MNQHVLHLEANRAIIIDHCLPLFTCVWMEVAA
jgi:hypothetical protein